MQTPIIVLSNFPDYASAESLAHHVVEERLAACVNILSGCRSVYRWKGAVEAADGVPVMIKTTQARYAALEEAIRAHHPYEVPEIVTVPITGGWPQYLAWITEETCTTP